MPPEVAYPLTVAFVLAGIRWPGKPIARWLWTRNVADPLTEWAELRIRAVVGNPNGKGDLYAMVEDLHGKLDAHTQNQSLHPVPPVRIVDGNGS